MQSISMSATETQATNSIILVKNRTYFPSKTKVMTMFYFRDPIVFFNIFFQNLFMNRVNEDTSMAFISSRQHEYILNAWSSSPSPDNTIFDSKLPFPNTRNYVWSHAPLNVKITELRKKEASEKKSGRPYLDTPVKKLIKDCLLQLNHYTIEITKKVLDSVMSSSQTTFSYQFTLPKQIRSSKISETNYSHHRLNMNVVEAIKVFAETFSKINSTNVLPKPEISTEPNTKPNTSSKPEDTRQDIECVSISGEEEEEEPYAMRSRHPFYIQEDGSLNDTSPVRRTKRLRIEDRPPTPFSPLRTPSGQFSFDDTHIGFSTPSLTSNILERNHSLVFSPTFDP